MTDEQKSRIQPFDVLEIPGNATRAEALAAYFKLSATYHPDRYFGKDIGDFRRMLEEIFDRLTWAKDTLDEMLP